MTSPRRHLLWLAVLTAVVGIGSRDGSGAEEALEAERRRLAGLAVDRYLEGQSRVMQIADRIRVEAAPFCGKRVGPVLGLLTATEKIFLDIARTDRGFEEAMQSIAIERFGLDRRPRVLLTVPGLSADLAGIRPGDVVTKVNGKKLDKRVRLERMRAKRLRGDVSLTVARGDEHIELPLAPRPGCYYPGHFAFGNHINAFATQQGKNSGMYIFSGMLRFLPSDDDLAVVMGHELAHLIQGTGGTRETEADADYLGLYLAARAGYDVTRASAVWDRMGRENPYSSIDWGFYAHPTSSQRALEIDATVREIQAKIAEGAALEPEERD